MGRSGKLISCVILIVIIAVILIFKLMGTGSPEGGENKVSRDFFSMDTVMNITVYGEEDEHANKAIDDAIALIYELDATLSSHEKDSDIYSLNQNGKKELTGYAAELFELAYGYSCDEELPFDIAIFPLVKLWDFDGKLSDEYYAEKRYDIPEDSDIEKALALTDIHDMEVNRSGDTTLEIKFKKEGMAVDLGGIAKGYASMMVRDLLKSEGIESAVINLGGNVVVIGSHADGSDFKIGIRNPEGGYFESVAVSDKAVVTSGAYERCFTGTDGKRYHHIIDPATGYPSDSGLMSVTVICDDPVLADVLSTSLFIMGKEAAGKYHEAHKGEFDMILLTENE